jgi:hypothetical protein
MTTINTSISRAWVKIAESSDEGLLVTWAEPETVEFATTAADAAPTVIGHALTSKDAITRAVLGAGYVWARAVSVDIGANVLLVVSK